MLDKCQLPLAASALFMYYVCINHAKEKSSVFQRYVNLDAQRFYIKYIYRERLSSTSGQIPLYVCRDVDVFIWQIDPWVTCTCLGGQFRKYLYEPFRCLIFTTFQNK